MASNLIDSFLNSAQLQDISSHLEHFSKAFHSITFRREPWLMGLVAFHLILPMFAFLLRRHVFLLIVSLFSLLCSVAFSPWINEAAAEYSHLFATEQYFDSQGYFMLCVWNLPVIVHALIMTTLIMSHVAELLVQVKRLQIRSEARRKQQAAKKAE